MKAQLGLVAALLLAGCGERAPDPNVQGSTTPPYVRAADNETVLRDTVMPVRIGELGPNFAACNARGAVRERSSAEAVPVRAAPFEANEEIDYLEAGAEFFICARSQDQRWFGIVYDSGGEAAARCGVSAPVPRRRAYPGPCAAGWVPSARVRLVSGVTHQVPAEGNTLP
ncbi:hypothetical protein RCO27_05700 [Sphingosinicella sp. LHD-64]|uniref:hypothetical protein n=1 Tax=Sphingosinicella sp. LHD-64 TaxID=3072139 RepID=UPI00280F942F|nr:hypothetical protein [Sphingosinicella sp. LHD-64]MDQ8755718.1 hypothetical protein [Sphingosinicella sp. LHD-64]